MADELKYRIDRIYDALGKAVEKDMTALPATGRETPRMVFFCRDFSGGQSQMEKR